MQRLTYVVLKSFIQCHRGKRQCQLCILLVNSRFHLCSSLAPRTMTVVFGMGMRLHVRMHTKLENRVLATDSNHSVVKSFIDLGKFEAIEALSGCRAPL